jgi:F0F1-type ATP synthase assembly protein I
MEELERITRLEAQHSEMMRLLQETRADMKEMHEDMHELKESLTKWKGISAGIAITVSLIWTVLLGIYGIFAGK